MSDTTKFVITKGIANEYYITIKQDDSTLPMVIEPADTFEVKIFKLKDSALVATIGMIAGTDGQVSVYDDANGKLKIVLSDALVTALVMERGDRADYYYSKPIYRLVIDASTVNNGDFIATIDKVYVRKWMYL